MSPTHETYGAPDAEAVLLLHGWPSGPHVWRRLTPMLATRFKVIVPELSAPDLHEQADRARDLLDDLEIDRVALVGHSHGGGVAQLVALRDDRVASLVLIDSIAFDQAPPTDLDPLEVVERGTVEIASLHPDDLAAYTATTAPPPEPVDLTIHAAAMSNWTFPVFLLWGEDDPFTPSALAERLRDAIASSTLGVVPDSGHFLLDDAFDTVGVLIHEYLRSRYLGAPHGHEGVVALQLERRPPWVDLAPYEEDDEPPPPTPDPEDQEVGPNR